MAQVNQRQPNPAGKRPVTEAQLADPPAVGIIGGVGLSRPFDDGIRCLVARTREAFTAPTAGQGGS